MKVYFEYFPAGVTKVSIAFTVTWLSHEESCQKYAQQNLMSKKKDISTRIENKFIFFFYTLEN